MKKLSNHILLLLLPLILSGCLGSSSNLVDEGEAAADVTISLLSISPPSVVLNPSDTYTFSGIGGTPPYTYSIDAGIGTIDGNGLYTAPATTGVTTIQVKDANNNTAFAAVTVGATLSLSPASTTIGLSETQTFTPTGGVAPYTYSLFSGVGSIDATTGVYTGSAIGSAVIKVDDSAGNSATSSLTVVNQLSFTTPQAVVETGTTVTYSASGGILPYTFSIYVGNGSINASTGAYTAPATAGTAIIRVTDNAGQKKEHTITIKKGPTLNLSRNSVYFGGEVTASTTDGTAPFTYSIDAGSGSINATTGVYTAGSSEETVTLRVTDTHGFIGTKNLSVFKLRDISTGGYHTCVTTFGGDNTTSESKCFGAIAYGVLFNGKAYTGDDLGEMGDNLSPINISTTATPNALYASYYRHKCSTFTNNKIKCWGDGLYGKLGVGNQNDYGRTPARTGDNVPFVNTASPIDTTIPSRHRMGLGGHHTCAIFSGGNLKCWGRNNVGQLGQGNTSTRYSPIDVNLGGNTAKQVATGSEFTCTLLNNGDVKCWGRNNYGQLGQGNTTQLGDGGGETPNLLTKVDIGAFTAIEIAAGLESACALRSNNSVVCWGRGLYGVNGIGNSNNIGDGAGEMGINLVPISFGAGKTPTSIYAKARSICALFSDNTSKCWGLNNFGQLGLGNTAYRGDGAGEMGDNLPVINLGTGLHATKIDLSVNHTCAILNNGSLKCWGIGSNGQLGSEGTDHLGNNAGEMGDSLAIVQLGTGKTAIDIAVNEYSTCALLNDNTIKCWGYNIEGETLGGDTGVGYNSSGLFSNLSPLNLGTNVEANQITSYGSHSCMVDLNNKVKCWGAGGNGRLGYENSTTRGTSTSHLGDNLPFVNLGTGVLAESVAAGANFSCALTTTNQIKCWGYNGHGQLGIGSNTQKGDNGGEMGDSLPFVDLGTGKSATKLTVGYAHACALLNTGEVKCWGQNNYGQLGIGSNTNKGTNPSHMGDNLLAVNLGTGKTAVDVSAGYYNTCAVLNDGTVKCWGYNGRGNLGVGHNGTRGNNPTHMGDNLAIAPLPSGRTAKKVIVAERAACVLMDNDKVACWGENYAGILGNGIGSGTRIGDNPGELGDNLRIVDLGPNYKAKKIVTNNWHACAVLDNNDVKCWGYNAYGQLGLGHAFNIGDDPLGLGDNLTPLTDQ